MKAPWLLASIAFAVVACTGHRSSPPTPYIDDGRVEVKDDSIGPAISACRDDGLCDGDLRCGPDGMCHRGGLCGGGNALSRSEAYLGTCSPDGTTAQWCAWDGDRLRHIILNWRCSDITSFEQRSVCQTSGCKDGAGEVVPGVYCCPP
jgi:hypothetical protein